MTNKTSVHNMLAAKLLKYDVTDINGNVKKYRFGSKIKDAIDVPGMSRTNVLGRECKHMVPQGLTYHDGYIFITAYCGLNEHNSVIYVIDMNTKKYVTTLVQNKKSHAGGMTYLEGNLWVCDGPKRQMSYYNYDDVKELIKSGEDSINLNKVENGTVEVESRASFCTSYKGYMCVGTFHLTDRRMNRLIFYKVDMTSKKMIPVKTINNLPLKCQGVTFHRMDEREYMILTASYGRTNRKSSRSKVHVYEMTKQLEMLDIEKSIKTITMPPMLEEVTIYEDKIYFVYESVSPRYRKRGAWPVVNSVCGFDERFIVG